MTILSIKAEKINTKVVKTTSNNYIHFLIPSSFIKAVRTEKVDVSSFNLLGLSKDVRIESSLDVNLYNKASDLLTVTTTKEGVNKKGEEIGEIKLSLNSIIYIVDTNNGVEVCVLLPNGSRTSIVSYIISETIEELITQIESDLIDSGGGTSSLFPKGYEFISESRDFLPTDEGKLLVLAAGVTITMPSEFPFLANQIVGVNALDSNCYYQDKAGSTVQIFGINNQPNEVVVLLSEPDFNSLLPISSSVIEGKTMLKYLYDKSQNAIPLSGTEVSNPVTGDIEIADDIKIKSVDVSATDGYLKFRTGQFEQKTTDNIGLTNSEIRSSGTGAFFRVTDNNTGFSNQISVSNVGIDVNSTDPLSRGLSAIQDFSPNITDLDYTQKIYVDNIAGKIVTLGTITFADINAALANTAISINLGNSVPMDYFPTAVGIKLVNSFLQTSPVFCELRIKVGTAASHFMGELLDLFSGVKLTETTNSPMSKPAVQQQDCVELYFNNGGGEVNPQDYTAGEFEVYAICKKYPF